MTYSHNKTIVILFILSAFYGCQTFYPTICTDQFVMINITVIDTNGNPADSVYVSVHEEWNNRIYDLSDVNYPNSEISKYGIYTIYHDVFSDDRQGLVKSLVVQGIKGELSFQSLCKVSSDECHVFKVSGPDTVIIK